VGWYDSERAAWIPSQDGLVIAILGADAQGRALIDVDGNGTPATAQALANLGLEDSERARLAGLYAPGTSLWRSRIEHLTPWDCNFPYVPDSNDPRAPDIPPELEDEPPECDTVQSGSSIRVSAGTLSESVPVAGTGHSLGFRSDRTEAYKVERGILATATGNAPPDKLLGVTMRLSVAGRTERFLFEPEPDQQIRIPWSHTDPYGRPLSGPVTGELEVCYVYGLRPVATRADFTASFAAISGSFGRGGGGRGGATLGLSRPRGAFKANLCSTWPLTLTEKGTLTDTAELGGWSFSAAHHLDTRSGFIQRGDGSDKVGSLSRPVFQRAVRSAAGSEEDSGVSLGATATSAGDIALELGNGPAPATALFVDEDGAILIAGERGVTRHFGTESSLLSGTETLTDVRDLARSPDGGVLLIAREGDAAHRLYRIDPEGSRSVLAGNGKTGCAPNSAVASAAPIADPRAMAVTSDGRIYIADTACHRVYRLHPDGTLVRTAGTGVDAQGGDLDSAALADVGAPSALALGPNEDLYIGSLHGVIRRMEPSGFMTTVAGTGTSGFSGDDGPAIEARLGAVNALAVGSDGRLYIDDSTANGRVRLVSLDGTIETIAGDGSFAPVSSGALARGGSMGALADIALDPEGRLFLAERTGDVWRIARPLLPLPWQQEILAPEGDLVHVFNRQGRHLETRDAINGSVLRTLQYDAQGRLEAVADFPGRVTRIERGADGVAIVAPDGQRTEVALDEFGGLKHIDLPEGVRWSAESRNDGALLGLSDPRGGTTGFDYDALGRLVTDTNPAGGGWVIDSLQIGNPSEVKMTSAEGRVYRYRRESRGGVRVIENTAPDGTVETIRVAKDGNTESRFADGGVTKVDFSSDPRWGHAARFPSYRQTTTPGGLRRETIVSREALLAAPDNPFSLERLTETRTVNGATWSNVYDATSGTETNTTPEGRRSTTEMDRWRRPVRVQVGNLAPVLYSYDEQGRISETRRGEGEDARRTLLTYDQNGHLESVTDPLGRTVGIRSDALGRVIETTAPDGRLTAFSYDPGGNVTALWPPGRAAHAMVYDAVGQETRYDPPVLDDGTGGIGREYNLDREATRLIHDRGPAIGFHYDETGSHGRLERRSTPEGDTYYEYDQAGRMSAATGAQGERIEYAYDGPLLVEERFSGSLNAKLRTAWNPEFRITEETLITVNDSAYAVEYGYDDDGLLTAAGALTITRDADNGLPVAATLGRIETDRRYNAFGELARIEAMLDGQVIYAVAYRRDKLGRIVEKTENITTVASPPQNETGSQPQATPVPVETIVTGYTYDLAGRLETVSENGHLTHSYAYDANGNRTHLDGAEIASYDEQDRLLSFTPVDERPVLQVPVTYMVDPRNRRIGKTKDGVLKHLLVYRDQLNPIAELDPDGSLRTLFVYAEQTHVPAYMVRIAETDIEHTYRILTDHLGSPRLVIDADTGQIAQRLDYDAWGRVTRDTNPGFQPFGFAGGLYDPDTGLLRFGARDYDPYTGRWTAKDPLGFDAGDVNLYAYVLADPVNMIDPAGLHHAGNGCVNGSGNSIPCPRDICATAECAAGIPPVPKQDPCLNCRTQCILDFVNPTAGKTIEKGAGAAGDSIGDVAGQIARYAAQKFNAVSAAYSLAECMNNCKTVCEPEECKN
jgi:RHS repeat-associated protein